MPIHMYTGGSVISPWFHAAGCRVGDELGIARSRQGISLARPAVNGGAATGANRCSSSCYVIC